ncbi:MAG: tetratricopeptide repeat protein [Rhodospirillales bacterium]|nr:tetratricopeptide repeat protein [Rhodospirillales bacterium]
MARRTVATSIASVLVIVVLGSVLLAPTGCVYIKVLKVRNQAEELYKQGRTAEIIPLVETAMAEMEEDLGPDHPYMAEAYNGLAVLYAYTLNDFARANDYFERALAIRTKALGPEHPDTIETINLMGFLYQVTGQIDRAEESFRRALRLRTKVLGPDHPDTADSQVYLAGLLLSQGRYAEAEELLLVAVDNEAREVSNRYPSPADSHSYLGALYSSLGDLDRSEHYYRQALEIREAALGPDHTITASSINALAFVYRNRGDLETAERYARRALDINMKNFGPEHGFTGDSLLFVGMLRLMQNDPRQAAEFMQRALDSYEKVLGPDNYRSLLAKLHLATLNLTIGDVARAKELSESALSSPQLHLLRELEWNGLVIYSLVLARSGNLDAAIIHGKQAVNIIQGLRADISGMEQGLQQGFVLERETAFRFLASMLVEQGRLPEAQQVLTMLKEQERYDFVRRDAGRGAIRTTTADLTPAEETWLGRYAEINTQLASIGRDFERLKLRKRQGLTDAEEARMEQVRADLGVAKQAYRRFLAEIDSEIKRVSKHRAMEIGEKNLKSLKSLQGTLRKLGNDVALVHYLVTDDKIHAILTTTRVQIVRTVDVQRSVLNQRVHALREAVQNPDGDPLPPAKALYDLVLAPIAQDLKQAGVRTLMFSLDDVLRYVPMAALHDGERYLAEDYRIALFTEAAESKLLDSPSDEWRLAGLGVTRAVGNFSPLPSVAAELDSIVRTDNADDQGVLPGVVYLDTAFTEEAVIDVLDAEFPVLHVASHFVFRPGTERNSFLLLGDGTEMSLAHILDLDLDFNSVELLTLSACETALGGSGADGREIESFGWLAQQQGAQSVLATLWPVADESTAQFMATLYDQRQAKGQTKAAALQATQIEFLRSDTYAHPFYWAPFILMGNWR